MDNVLHFNLLFISVQMVFLLFQGDLLYQKSTRNVPRVQILLHGLLYSLMPENALQSKIYCNFHCILLIYLRMCFSLKVGYHDGLATSLSLVITRHRGETGRHHKT